VRRPASHAELIRAPHRWRASRALIAERTGAAALGCDG
jgi:hypothetical protein